jgi:hypothetical protein
LGEGRERGWEGSGFVDVKLVRDEAIDSGVDGEGSSGSSGLVSLGGFLPSFCLGI